MIWTKSVLNEPNDEIEKKKLMSLFLIIHLQGTDIIMYFLSLSIVVHYLQLSIISHGNYVYNRLY